MKVLIYGINYHPELTGVGKYTGEMAEWLSNNNHEVRVITAAPYYPHWVLADGYKNRYQTSYEHGVSVTRCPHWIPSNVTAIKRLIHLLSFAITSFPVLLRQLFWRPDILIVVEPPFFILPQSALFAKVFRVKSLLHIQDFEIDAAFELGMLNNARLRRLISYVESRTMLAFDKVSSISPNMLARACSKGVPRERLIEFPNWVDTSLIYPDPEANYFRNKYNIPSSTKVILYSGNMGEKQGLEIVIEVARKFSKSQDVLFVMCGSGSAKKRLVSMSKGVENVLWIDLQPLSKLNELLNFSDIHLLPQCAGVADLVMPSKLTGMFSSGKPVIATASHGTQLAHALSETGIVVEPGNVNELYEAIVKLVSRPDLCKELGQNAREYALKYFEYNKIMRKFSKEIAAL